LFAEQRMEIIKNILKEKRHENIITLSTALNVSDVTIRKYLDILEKQGYLTKVHGGAIWTEDQPQVTITKPDLERKLKAIAELSSTLVSETDSIYIGSGMTCSAFAGEICKKPSVSVITNNVQVLNSLAGKVQNLTFIGGDVEILPSGCSYTHGSKSKMFLENIVIGKAFIGCDGVDFDSGITVHSLNRFESIRQIIDISKEVHVLCISQKFGKVALYRTCSLDKVSTIVTDWSLDDFYKRFYFENNVRLLTGYEEF
jgi:DeoR family fructose operon transcriptional repressor